MLEVRAVADHASTDGQIYDGTRIKFGEDIFIPYKSRLPRAVIVVPYVGQQRDHNVTYDETVNVQFSTFNADTR